MFSLRLLLPLALLVMVALALFSSFQTIQEQDRQAIFADTRRDQEILISRLREFIEDAWRHREPEAIRRQMASLSKLPEIELAILVDGSGKVLFSAQPDKLNKLAASLDADAALAPPPPGRTWVAEQRGRVLSSYPVSLSSAPGEGRPRTATLFVAANPAPLLEVRQAQTRAWMRRTDWVMGAVVLLAWLLVHFLISRRLGRLMQVADVLGLRDMSARESKTGVSGGDEIGLLGRAFDKMIRHQESSAARLRLLAQAVEQSGASVVITDRRGVIEYVNAAFTTISGYSSAEAIGKNAGMLGAGQTDGKVYAEMWATISAGKTWRGEMRNRRKNGELYWDSVIINPVYGEDGRIVNYVGVQEDVSARKEVEQTLLLNTHILNSVHEGIAVTDADLRFRFVNPAFSAITGYAAEEVIGKSPKLLSSGLMDRTFYGTMWGDINESGHWQGEIIDRRKNGESYPEWLSISTLKDEAGKTTHFISVFTDISERKAVEKRITHMSQHDFLTGLPNRMLLLDRMEQALAHARREQRKVAVLFVDMDRFKHINDMMGHVLGDKLLQEVAARLDDIRRIIDTVCRLGGDEFVFMMPDVGNADDISGMAEKILRAVAEPCLIDGHELEITASIGIAVFPDDGEGSLEMLQHADTAMYQAKQDGRNKYHYFTSEMNRRALARMSIEHKLRRALEREEFTLHYQPQVDLASGRTVGVEALLRWHDKIGGEFIPPGEFIPIAEENGMIVPIGEWVLGEACRQMAAWREMGLPEITVAINLSAVQCRQKNLAESFRNIMARHGVDPAYVELEITETAVMKDAETAIALLHELKAMGVQLAMDDFGTGYSSLSHLKRLPIDKLKIDQSFVRDIAQDPDDAAIVSTIISMARSLELKVVAEGVETEKQLTFLNRHGCDQGQGYYFARPMPHHEFASFIGNYTPA